MTQDQDMKDKGIVGKIALGVFLGGLAVLAVINAPQILDWTVGAITGWDAKEKAGYAEMLEANRRAFDEQLKYQARMDELRASHPTITSRPEKRPPAAKALPPVKQLPGKFALRRPHSVAYIPLIEGARYHQAESAMLDFNGQLGHYDVITVAGIDAEAFRPMFVAELERDDWHKTLDNCWQTLQFENIEDLCIDSSISFVTVLHITPTPK